MSARPRLPRAALALAAVLGLTARAAAQPASTPSGFQGEMQRAVATVMATYGPDAANLAGNLLQRAIHAGSLLDASVSIAAPEEHDGAQFLVFELDSGIVYDPALEAPRRAATIWTDIVDPALAKCRRLDLRADGILLRIRYRLATFRDRADLQQQLRDGAVGAETAAFRLLVSDVVARANDRLTPAALATQARSEIDGRSFVVQIPSETAPPGR